jgi:hypothetical protein
LDGLGQLGSSDNEEEGERFLQVCLMRNHVGQALGDTLTAALQAAAQRQDSVACIFPCSGQGSWLCKRMTNLW